MTHIIGMSETKGFIMRQLANLGIKADIILETGDIMFNLINCDFLLEFTGNDEKVEIECTVKDEEFKILNSLSITTLDEMLDLMSDFMRLKLGGK